MPLRHTPQEVSRRHCLAQVSAEEGEPPYYLIEYTVESSRGRKVYVCKYCIFNKRLYVLQAQSKQDLFDAKDEDGASVREALRAAVSSFRVLESPAGATAR